MKLLIETCLEKMFLSLVDSKGNTVSHFAKNEKFKSDLLNLKIVELLNSNKTTLDDIDGIYVTEGPGSFMGARTGLIYAKTIAQMKPSIDLYVASSFVYSANGIDGTYYINASGKKLYECVVKGDEYITTLVDGINTTPIDYDAIMNNKNFTKLFHKVDDVVKAEPNYIKQPTIGGN